MGMYVLNFNQVGHIVWQPELFNILNLGFGIQIKLWDKYVSSCNEVGGIISGDVVKSALPVSYTLHKFASFLFFLTMNNSA